MIRKIWAERSGGVHSSARTLFVRRDDLAIHDLGVSDVASFKVPFTFMKKLGRKVSAEFWPLAFLKTAPKVPRCLSAWFPGEHLILGAKRQLLQPFFEWT
jgi:hypothetical protein